MWSKTSHRSFREFRFICGRFGHSKGSNATRLVYTAGFIRVREMSGKFKIFQGQGIVREFHNLSGKIEFLLKCQGDVREF